MSTLDNAVRMLAGALANAAATWSDPELLRSFLRDIGWSLDAVPGPIAGLGASIQALATLWDAVRDSELTGPQVEQLGSALEDLWTAMVAVESMPDPPEVAGAGFARDLARTIVDYWLIDTVEREAHFALPLFELLGIVEIRHIAELAPRRVYTLRRIAWDRIPALLTDPGEGFRARFGWGSAAFAADEVLSRIRALLSALHWSTSLREIAPAELAAAGGPSTERILGVDLQLLQDTRDVGDVEAGVRFLPIAPPGALPGLALVPYVAPGLDVAFALDDNISVKLDATFDLAGGVVLSWLPDRGLALTTDVGGGGTARTTGHITAALAIDDPARPDKTVIDALGLTLRARTVQGLARVALEPTPVFGIEAELKDGVLRWDSSQAPGVLGRLFGGRTFEMSAALAIGWDSMRGFYLRGGTALETSLPLALQLGPLKLSAVRVAAGPVAGGGVLTIGIDGTVSVGPVAVGWQRLGVQLAVSRGSQAPIDFAIDAALPELISLAITTPVLGGAGVIQRSDPDHFAGALVLQAIGFNVAAVAAISRAPTGTSIAALVSARWPGIPVGLGFTLDGITGVLGIDRRVDVDALRGQLRNGAVAQLLGPQGDPSATLAALQRVFPAAPGRFVVGLGPTIGWGSPRVLEADLALLVELPSPIRLDLLASIQLGLPDLEHRVVDIRLDALGVIDLERKTLALDASLHDSTLAGYKLSGDMALRLGWGAGSQFLLSIGGFHPHFTPPPGFPTLRRLALTAGDNPQLRLSSYLALTANTAQVGAQADLTATGGGFEIQAHLGFDALFEFVPFRFETEIVASASIAWHGHRLVGVHLDFLLTGPHPWHAKGDATFGILWWDVSVGFDETWGDATPQPLSAPPPIAAALTDALGRPEAWSSELAEGEPPWLTLGPAAGPSSTIFVHPFAALVVRQHAVPLGYRITQFGNIPLPGAQQFDITAVRIGATTTTIAPVNDSFAPGQFTQLTADQRLSAPSFESFACGARISADEARLGPSARSAIDTDTEVVDPLAPPPQPPRSAPVPSPIAVLAPVVRPVRLPPLPPRTGPRLVALPFVFASVDDLSITAEGAALAGGSARYAQLRELLAARTAATGRAPRLQIVPRVQVANHSARVVVVGEDSRMRNIDFVDTVTGRAMSRQDFVDAIHAGSYPDYYVRTIRGTPTPVSRPNATIDDNLG